MSVYLGENKVNLVLKANNGNNVEWADILNKPESYVPSTHAHTQYQLSGNYLTASTFIPSKTSDLTNDSGFLSSHQSLANYYTKSETSSATQIKAALNDASGTRVSYSYQVPTLSIVNATEYFNELSTYAEGHYVTYNNQNYVCISAISLAGSWTGDANWVQVDNKKCELFNYAVNRIDLQPNQTISVILPIPPNMNYIADAVLRFDILSALGTIVIQPPDNITFEYLDTTGDSILLSTSYIQTYTVVPKSEGVFEVMSVTRGLSER